MMKWFVVADEIFEKFDTEKDAMTFATEIWKDFPKDVKAEFADVKDAIMYGADLINVFEDDEEDYE